VHIYGNNKEYTSTTKKIKTGGNINVLSFGDLPAISHATHIFIQNVQICVGKSRTGIHKLYVQIILVRNSVSMWAKAGLYS